MAAHRSYTVGESLHTRSFWMLWITWTMAGAAGVSMTILSTGYGLFLGFALPSAVLLLTAFNLTNGISRLASGMPLVADCFGLDHFGAIFGLTFAAYGFVAGPLGPTLSGYLLDITGGNYTLVFVYLGIFCVLASACIRQVVPQARY